MKELKLKVVKGFCAPGANQSSTSSEIGVWKESVERGVEVGRDARVEVGGMRGAVSSLGTVDTPEVEFQLLGVWWYSVLKVS